MDKVNLPPNPSKLMEGLRDTGYDFNTALADIVDNSVDANATKIDIYIKMDGDGDKLIMVADNGCGMDKTTLKDGMTYGSKGDNNPKRLGKFGLGLKTASTAYCRRLSVITRHSADVEPLKATWDLDHVVKVAEWELLLESPTNFEKKYLEKTAENSSGTLVIWGTIDRLLKEYATPGGKYEQRALDKRVKSFREHAGMIYQRFLDPEDDRARNIEMNLNGKPIDPWNPFFESEPQTEMVADESIKVEVGDGTETEFQIRAFVLPRNENFSTEEAAESAKINNDNQGIYIYRENRLIHPADWLGMYTKEPHYSLLRIEFSFNHELDEAFQVDIKKSQIILNEELYKFVHERFLPAPRTAANDRYRTGKKKKVQEESEDAHDESNRNISGKEKDLKGAEIDVVDEEQNDVEVTNKSGKVSIKLDIESSVKPGQVFVKPVESIVDGLLWKPALVDGNRAVLINTGHPYYSKVYVPNLSSGVLIQGMDSLLWSLIEAELRTMSETTKNHMQDLRFEVSRILRKLVEDLPEPVLEEE
ncbi:ATP-binding protein [Rhodohalobacter sulfatireducens]|uniref:ATP-binding protein n=1 Tax=Rhodohalobacter sulfatireducens TaxID=2911366 RepID=A0ABS9KIU2_9BACT|nr:ATP-binding protein [Rhodohalobacter sulfatireducens]MCG2590761.1 ATP-binding protein [Rhodohalobacter sulfatireducens]